MTDQMLLSNHSRAPMTVEEISPIRVESLSAPIDLDAAERAVSDLLKALGRDPFSPHLAETPRRVAAAFAEMLTPAPFEATTFDNDGDYDGLVVAKDIPLRSLCEHHMLPFTGVAHVAYLPGERIIGLSKLARIVEHFSAGFQVQERLTTQVSSWLDEHLAAKGVGVVIEAEHSCMSLRGIRVQGSRTVTSSVKGVLRSDFRSRQEFLDLVQGRRSGS